MLVVFRGIQGITHYRWLPRDSTLGSPFFCREVLGPLAQKLQSNSNNTRKRFTLIHMNNGKAHAANVTQAKLDVSPFKRTPQPPYSPDIAPSDFFFSVGLKPSLNGESMMGKMN
jgi:histone-lysine N-methyltransferase SETMAR